MSLPVRYVGDRFFVTPVTTSGDTVVLITDSGGALVIAKSKADPTTYLRFVGMEQRDSAFSGGRLPPFKPGASIPVPLGAPGGSMFVIGDQAVRRSLYQGATGILGHQWFAGRVWVLDYPAQRMSVYDKPPTPQPFGPHTIPMTLKQPPGTSYPRISVVIDGDTLQLLLGTGASTQLTAATQKALGGPAIRATSFIAHRIANRWAQRHPDWRMLDSAEAGTREKMIQVPVVTVAGHSVGPVWFTLRADKTYDEFMSQYMDKPIVGSLGGDGLRYFRVTLDYPNRRATFEKP